jgi:xanthine dehydrogenase D subunit
VSREVAERTRRGVGENVRRVDGVPKVKGQFAYGSDLWAEGMLYGQTLRSPHAHARIRSIDISDAVASPGVHAVLLAGDIPGKKTFGLEFSDQPVLADDVVRYAGEPVGIVAAETPELARRAARRIKVDYEVLPAVTDSVQALQSDSPQVHPFGNVLRHVRVVHGDPDAAADVWVEGYYETGMQDQAALGPEAGLAVPAEDGGIDLYVSTQWLHADLEQIAPCLALPEGKVRLHLAGVGGAFGSREDVHMQIHGCLLAQHAGKPVKMSYGREESFFGHVHRHPFRMWMRHGATRDGRLVNLYARLVADGGAYCSSSPAVIGNAATFAAGPYEMPNALIEATMMYSNNPPCGAMRGFGAVQANFAYESQMDKLARALGMDPLELRLRNALKPGSILPTGQEVKGVAPVRQIIERLRDMPMPEATTSGDGRRDPITLPGGAAGNVGRGEGLKRGVGYSIGYKNVGYSEGFDDYHEARVRLFRGPNGPTAEVYSAAAEVGQGVHTIMLQVARSVLGIDDVVLHQPDTGVGSAGSSSASRQTMMAGGAVELSCQGVLEELLDRVREHRSMSGQAVGDRLSVEDGRILVDGVALADVDEFLDQPIEVTRRYHHRQTTPLDENGQGDVHVIFVFGGERAVVEVDADLGLTRVVEIAAVQDVGRAMNPQSVYGQIEGGTAQSLGLALMEELQVKEGLIKNASFTDYLIPTILDMPPVVAELIEEPEPDVPFGAKGIGESATLVAAAAVTGALRDATGQELNRIPVRPDDLVGINPPVEGGPVPPSPEVPGPLPIPAYLGMGQDTQHKIGGEGGKG